MNIFINMRLGSIVTEFYFFTKQIIKSNFAYIFAYIYIRVYLIILLIINLGIWLIALFINSQLTSDQIALHYNVDFGIDYYGDASKIYIIPLLGLAIIIINTLLLVSIIKHKDRLFVSNILFMASLVANLLLLAAIISIYIINFR